MTDECEIIVSIAPDGGQARLSAPAGLSAATVTAEAIRLIVEQAGVVIDQHVQRNIAEFAARYGDGEAERTAVIATGTPPVHGDDARVEWNEGFDPSDHASTPGADAPDAADSVDHYAGRDYVRVTTGDIIGVVHESTDGTDGSDVRGRVVEHRPGRPLAIKFHSSVSIDSAGQILAQNDGVLMLSNDELSVSQVLEVAGDIDFSTGNIDFAGSVAVAGAIRPGFVVRAKNDLRVAKLIEGAEIGCGGDLFATGGMVGQGRGTLTVGHDARLPYLDSVKGLIGGDLIVEREINDCRLIVGNDLRCPNGAILGGEVVVTGSLIVKVLGSQGWSPTTVMLGDVPLLRANRRKLAKAVEVIKCQIANFAEQERVIRLNPRLSHNDKEKLTELGFEAGEQERELGACTAELAEADDAIRSRRKLDVHIAGTIYPKVTLRIGQTTVRFTEVVSGPLWICWDATRQLVYRTGSGTVQPLAEIAQVLQDRDVRSGDGAASAAA